MCLQSANRLIEVGILKENVMRTPHSVFQNRRPLKQTRTLIVLLIVVALVAIDSGPRSVTARSTATQSAVFQTTTVPMLAGTAQPINNGPGWQTDPHVSCEMVSYTNDDNQGTLQNPILRHCNEHGSHCTQETEQTRCAMNPTGVSVYRGDAIRSANRYLRYRHADTQRRSRFLAQKIRTGGKHGGLRGS